MQNVREFWKSFNKSQTTLFSRKPPSSLRHISLSKSNGNANQHSFTVSYLVNNSSSNLILGFETAIKDSRVFCSSTLLRD
ncbi:hypothetical protein NC652_031962 [Populus alba x Populus x berolinensis]|nr:hypothetical protein NC652_031962 [Populus alba x Populus x berolinensis]